MLLTSRLASISARLVMLSGSITRPRKLVLHESTATDTRPTRTTTNNRQAAPLRKLAHPNLTAAFRNSDLSNSKNTQPGFYFLPVSLANETNISPSHETAAFSYHKGCLHLQKPPLGAPGSFPQAVFFPSRSTPQNKKNTFLPPPQRPRPTSPPTFHRLQSGWTSAPKHTKRARRTFCS